MPNAMPDAHDGAPPFTAKQEATIRKIARKTGMPARDRNDFVRKVWLEVSRCWAKVPKQEPDTSRYVNGIAHNMAVDEAKRRKKDPTQDPVLFSALPRDFVAPQGPSVHERILARDLMAMATARDPKGADWMYRSVVEDERHTEIAASAGERPDTVRKRVKRLLAWMRERGNLIVGFVALAFFGAQWARGELFTNRQPVVSAPASPTPQERAAALRAEASVACDDSRFMRCEELLDEARALDPEGESDPIVLEARDAIARARKGATERAPAP